MNEWLWRSLIRCIPKRTVSRLFGVMARQSWTRYFIPLYVRMYNIDTSELTKDLSQYTHLTDFFTRRLDLASRQVDMSPSSVVSPVDGTVSQLGKIDGNECIQAKGHDYNVDELLAGYESRATAFRNGCFLTLYLSPKDYHRVHAPASGFITEMIHQPGTLYPVNERGTRLVKRLFVNNERVTTVIQTPFGSMALVQVGAMNVGSVKVSYDERVQTNVIRRKVREEEYKPPIPIQKGEELGWFEFGSTVIVLFPPNAVTFLPDLQPGSSVRMGKSVARVLRDEEGS